MYRAIVFILISFIIVACGSSGGGGGNANPADYLAQLNNCESSNSDPLIGCWYSEICPESITQPGYFQQSVLNFHSNGSLNYGMRFYDNSNCSGTPYYVDATPPDTYAVVSNVTSSGGLDTTILALNSSGITLYNAYHITASVRLCFNTNEFQLNGNGGGLVGHNFVQPSGANISIDTANGACLTK